jgi:dolichol-phosphate mannosyltransferase
MSAEQSLSIVIPAYNEAENIHGTLKNVTAALAGLSLDSEIIVVDDGSLDGTAAVVSRHAGYLPGVRVVVNERNMGFGWTYRRGVQEATRDHIVMVHGDNAWGADTLRELFRHVVEADVVIGYTRDMWGSRTWTRALVSQTFTCVVNAIARRQLMYYNGPQIHRSTVLKSLRIQSAGYGFQAEVLVKALRLANSFIEVPMDLMERERGESKAFRLKNAVDVARTLKLLCALEWSAGGR